MFAAGLGSAWKSLAKGYISTHQNESLLFDKETRCPRHKCWDEENCSNKLYTTKGEMKEKGRNGRLKKRNWFIHLMKPELVCLLSSFGLNEMKVCIGSPGKLDCLCSKKQFSAGKGQVPNQL